MAQQVAILKVSATTLNTLADCEGAAKARLEGIYGASSVRAFVGSVAHRMFARRLRGGDLTDLDLAVRQEIGGSNLQYEMKDVGIKRMSELKPVVDEIRDMMTRFDAIVADDPTDVEVYVERDREDDVKLLGRIDAVFSGPRLTDWKTGQIGKVRAQLLFYAFVWRASRGETPTEVEAISFKTGEVFREDVDDDLLDAAGIDIDLQVAKLQDLKAGADPVLTPGVHCRWCPVRITCPAAIA